MSTSTQFGTARVRLGVENLLDEQIELIRGRRIGLVGNQGVPVLRLSRAAPVSRSLSELVELVTARRVVENKGLFDRLFGRTDTDQ